MESLTTEIETLNPDLVVMGSEVLGTPGGGGGGLLTGASTSITLALAKAALPVPLLIVKPNSVGELFKRPGGIAAGPGPIKIAFEVSTGGYTRLAED